MAFLSRRQLAVFATSAAGALVVLLVLALVPWPALRHLDAAGPTAGHALLTTQAGARTAVRAVTDLGSALVVDFVTAIAALVLLMWRRWRAAVVVAVARVGELVTVSLLKVVVHRARPALLPHLTSAQGYSFPSGHTAGSAAVYGVVAVIVATAFRPAVRRWVLAGAAVLTAAVAASRVMLGVHFPTDVLAGAALGLVWVAVAILVVPAARAEEMSAKAEVDQAPGADDH